MIHEVLLDRLMMYINQAHNIYIKTIPVIKHKCVTKENYGFSILVFYVRKQLLLSAHLSHRNSVHLSVRRTGGSVKSGAS